MQRSADSIEFEKIWRSLRTGSSLIPTYDEFHPAAFGHLLSRIGLFEIRLADRQFIMRLMPDFMRAVAGRSLRDSDINSIARPEQMAARLERQRLYHDHPMGKADHMLLEFPDGAAMYELTSLPIWGLAKERMVLTLGTDVGFPKQGGIFDEGLDQTYQLEEILIDIGAGVPAVEHVFV